MSAQTNVTPFTELDAVNLMLSSIGEAPVNQLDDTLEDVTTAQFHLRAASLAVQGRGYTFNEEYNYPLNVNGDGNIVVPENFLVVDLGPQYTVRGNKVYDRVNHTFQMASALNTARVVLALPYEDLPSAARNYILQNATQTFQAATVGATVLWQFTEQQVVATLAELRRYESQTGNPNIFGAADLAAAVDRSLAGRSAIERTGFIGGNR